MPQHDKSIQKPSIRSPFSTAYHHLISPPPTPNSSGAVRLPKSDLQQSFNGTAMGKQRAVSEGIGRSKSLRERFQSFNERRKHHHTKHHLSQVSQQSSPKSGFGNEDDSISVSTYGLLSTSTKPLAVNQLDQLQRISPQDELASVRPEKCSGASVLGNLFFDPQVITSNLLLLNPCLISWSSSTTHEFVAAI